MRIEFLSKSNKDLDKLKVTAVKKSVVEVINKIELANQIYDIPNIKKLKGHDNAYRIKIGDYRIGIFLENDTIEMARIVHRKDIYKLFP